MGFCPGGILSGGYFPGDIVRGDIVLEPMYIVAPFRTLKHWNIFEFLKNIFTNTF